MNIVKSVEGIQKIFDAFKSDYMLLSGNIEKNLKFFIGMICEENIKKFSYVCDKNTKGHEIDFLGFKNGKPCVAAELKCTFAYAKSYSKGQAKDAVLKIRKTIKIKNLESSTKQIIHFLNTSNPKGESSLNPGYIKEKYKYSLNKTVFLTIDELETEYRSTLGRLKYKISSHEFEFKHSSVGLAVLVITFN